ncbi:unnamed protein product [Rotaria sordida]|uniref:Uncharacterized protein n=1 Tax=Rotaria sordida TaxID=392033 RepID=A0A814YF70_9BILA|nr:unnamed protein product [Rotaria sordida]
MFHSSLERSRLCHSLFDWKRILKHIRRPTLYIYHPLSDFYHELNLRPFINIFFSNLKKKIISLLACCNRSSVGCATYVMIKNILAFIFSAVLIDFDRRFINGQLSDYTTVDDFRNCISSYNSNTNYGNILLSLAKAQLAASVIILVSSLVFIAIYIYVYIRAVNDDRGGNNENFPSSGQRQTYAIPQANRPYKVPPPTEYQEEATYRERNIMRSVDGLRTVVCQNCGTTIDIPERL